MYSVHNTPHAASPQVLHTHRHRLHCRGLLLYRRTHNTHTHTHTHTHTYTATAAKPCAPLAGSKFKKHSAPGWVCNKSGSSCLHITYNLELITCLYFKFAFSDTKISQAKNNDEFHQISLFGRQSCSFYFSQLSQQTAILNIGSKNDPIYISSYGLAFSEVTITAGTEIVLTVGWPPPSGYTMGSLSRLLADLTQALRRR